MPRDRKLGIATPKPLSESDIALLSDPHAWAEVGAELRSVDPQRYVALLKIARDVVDIHHDPIGPTRTQRDERKAVINAASAPHGETN